MIKIENVDVVGWEAAIRGMFCFRIVVAKVFKHMKQTFAIALIPRTLGVKEYRRYLDDFNLNLKIGPYDLDLMTRLRNAGTDHRKFMRMIAVYADITGPLYWWKEFDTYKVGTVANSCSTMHKIHEKEFTLGDFSHDHLTVQSEKVLLHVIKHLNMHRMAFLTTNTHVTINGTALSDEACVRMKKDIWWQMIQLLPSSYNQKRTVMLNYEVLANMYKSRKNHKLNEWVDFCKWIESLPYSEIITGKDNKDGNNVQ